MESILIPLCTGLAGMVVAGIGFVVRDHVRQDKLSFMVQKHDETIGQLVMSIRKNNEIQTKLTLQVEQLIADRR